MATTSTSLSRELPTNGRPRHSALMAIGLLALISAACMGPVSSVGNPGGSRSASVASAPPPSSLAVPSSGPPRGQNGRILFEADTAKGRQIFTIGPDGHDLVQVTRVEGGAVLADWAPDGEQIAFTHDKCAIATIDPDGGDLRVIASDPEFCFSDPSYLPDGSRLVFTRFEFKAGIEQIWSMEIDGADHRFVTARGGPDPNVSPDGTKLSYKEPSGALMVEALDGGGAVPVSPSVSVTYKHDWAPDGQQLVVSDDSDPSPGEPVNILILTPDGSETRYLTDYPAPLRASVGGYSPDGEWIVFRLEGDGIPAMYRIRPDGSGRQKVFESATVVPRFIDWGPKPRG